MKIKSFLAKPYAAIIYKKIRKSAQTAVADQDRWRNSLVKAAQNTLFGKDHQFHQINSYEEFKQAVPIRDYEALAPYIEKIKSGTQNVLWKGKPLYFAKTSGTTSGTKYIPITKDSISNHIDTAKYALLNYMHRSNNPAFADGNMIFLSGSPELTRVGGIPTGRLSGIVNHHVPAYLRTNQLPSYKTNCIEDWEEKLAKIVEETKNANMTLVSGIPPWMQMYFDWLLEATGKSNVMEVFPNLQVIIQGGVNFAPYRDKLFKTIGKEIDTVETYPASEGFIAFQDLGPGEGLRLNTDSGIFFEFIPADKYFDDNPPRLKLDEVELNKNYTLVINSNAGLWGYSIGDTVKFVSLNPYRIVVSGRIKHYISAFGEHVIGEEVDETITEVAKKFGVNVIEYTVAPKVQTDGERPYHEWFIEAENIPTDEESFRMEMDLILRKKNIYYNDLISGNILQPLKINWLPKGSFIKYMQSIGKLGGQNKLPRLSNDRNIADALYALTKERI